MPVEPGFPDIPLCKLPNTSEVKNSNLCEHNSIKFRASDCNKNMVTRKHFAKKYSVSPKAVSEEKPWMPSSTNSTTRGDRSVGNAKRAENARNAYANEWRLRLRVTWRGNPLFNFPTKSTPTRGTIEHLCSSYFLLAACCGRDIHHSAPRKRQVKSGDKDLAGPVPFLCGDKIRRWMRSRSRRGFKRALS